MEFWKDLEIDDLKNQYEISNYGQIRNKKTLQIKKYKVNSKTGYISQNFSIKGKDRYFYLHRLVAKHFMENFIEELTVNHKDGNKSNNEINNLECMTVKENVRHGFETGLFDNALVEIEQYDLKGNYIDSYSSIAQASRETSISIQNIQKCTSNEQKHSGGFQWIRKDSKRKVENIEKESKRFNTKIEQRDLNGNLLKTYDSLKDAYNLLKRTNNGLLSRACKGMNKTAYGFIWNYKI